VTTVENRVPNREVEEFLDQWAARTDGAIPFEAWMEAALHHPRYGYYARQVRDVGRRGDFSTAATLHPALSDSVLHAQSLFYKNRSGYSFCLPMQ